MPALMFRNKGEISKELVTVESQDILLKPFFFFLEINHPVKSEVLGKVTDIH